MYLLFGRYRSDLGGLFGKITYLSAELRPRFDELCWIGHEPDILDVISDSINNYRMVMIAHASIAPAVDPAIKECKGFSFLEVILF